MSNYIRHIIFSLVVLMVLIVMSIFLLQGISSSRFNQVSLTVPVSSNPGPLSEVLTPTSLFSQTIDLQELPFLNLTFRLTTNREHYVLGEIVEFTVELSNKTNAPITGHTYLHSNYGFLEMHISNGSEDIKEYKGATWDRTDFIPSEEILPTGSVISETATIYFNRSTLGTPDQYLAFPKVGTYFLQAALRNIGSRDLLLSNIVRVEIVQPTGSDGIVWKQLRQYENAIEYQSNYEDGFRLNGLLPLLAQFPDSIYAQNIKEKFAQTQPLSSRQESQVQPTPVDQTELRSITVADQHFMVKVLPSVSVENEAALINELVQLVEQWTSAWNNRDLQSYAESYSYSTYTRQDWEAGPSNRHYNELRDRVEELFVKNGKMAVELFDFTIGANEVTANVVVNFEMGNNKYTFDTMRFVKDDDGVWRLASP